MKDPRVLVALVSRQVTEARFAACRAAGSHHAATQPREEEASLMPGSTQSPPEARCWSCQSGLTAGVWLNQSGLISPSRSINIISIPILSIGYNDSFHSLLSAISAGRLE